MPRDTYDGDPRASYLLLDEGAPTIRRVADDVDRALTVLAARGLPGAEWTRREADILLMQTHVPFFKTAAFYIV